MLLKDKRREEIKKKQNMNYADITRRQGNVSAQQPVTRYIYPDITKEETLKINILCVAHAHYKNLEKPGTYGEELNKVLTANNLPNIVIPECPRSEKNTNNGNTRNQRESGKDRQKKKEIKKRLNKHANYRKRDKRC